MFWINVLRKQEGNITDHFWLNEEKLKWIEPYFPLSYGEPGIEDRKVVGGIIHVIRNGLRWWDPRMSMDHINLI